MSNNVEIVLQQVSYHCSLKDILNLRTINTFMKTLIRECIYTHIIVKFNDIVNNYLLFKCFQSLKCKKNITNDKIKHLGNCYMLDLANCAKITNNGIKYLSKCHTLDLEGCNKITDAGIKYLENCHTLNLTNCTKITDKRHYILSKCFCITLCGCDLITNKGYIC